MRIAGRFSLKRGAEVLEAQFSEQLREVQAIIEAIDSAQHLTKVSREKTIAGRQLYHPRSLNAAFRSLFEGYGWQKHKVFCEYSTDEYEGGYQPQTALRGAYREMDFVKARVGVEVQFGKYAFMVYNVCAKMTIFHKLDVITVGVEVVPMKEFAANMSTGVSYFEQFVWDLKQRGEADIDIPVLILGITA
jgi:hypothetical protein